MAASKRPAKKPGAPSVEAFLAALDHPRKQDILTVRQIILGADPRIQEAIKWNAPSFHILLGAAPLEQSRFALAPASMRPSGFPTTSISRRSTCAPGTVWRSSSIEARRSARVRISACPIRARSWSGSGRIERP